MAEYTYVKENVNLDTLTYEIRNNDSIVTVLSHINFEYPDNLDIYFLFDLSSIEITALDSIVSSHTGSSLEDTLTEEEYINYKLINSNVNSYVIGSSVYNYDTTREKWFSSSKRKFEFARKGSASGMYIPLLGDLDGVDDVYTPEQPSTILGIYCKSSSSSGDKTIYIHKNGVGIFDFSYSDETNTYINNSLNIDIETTDMIQIYVESGRGNIRNTLCRIEYAWRYDV